MVTKGHREQIKIWNWWSLKVYICGRYSWPTQQLFPTPFLFACFLRTRLKMPYWISPPPLQPVFAMWPIPGREIQWQACWGAVVKSFPLDKEVRPIKKILFAFVFLLCLLLMRTDSGSCGRHFESSPTLWGRQSGMIERALVHDVVYNVTESLDKLQDRLSQDFLITKQ